MKVVIQSLLTSEGSQTREGNFEMTKVVPSLVRKYDYFTSLHWLLYSFQLLDLLNDFWPSLVRKTLYDYLHLLEWLCMTTFSC